MSEKAPITVREYNTLLKKLEDIERRLEEHIASCHGPCEEEAELWRKERG